jgi:peptide/nickel transport system ATP-binding protein
MPESAAPKPEPPLLSVRNLKVSFRTPSGLVPAVDGLNFELATHEILGVVGESGCGKSVSLMAIMGLLDPAHVLVEGSVRLKGRELIGLSAVELQQVRGRQIAMVFQDPMTTLTPVHRVGAQIVEQLRAHTDLGRVAARHRAIELLAAVGLPQPQSVFERYPHELSGGMRQRAVIAMAVSCNPEVLFADEPTTALDVTVQAQILALLDRLRQASGTAVLLVTHDMGVVAEVADRMMVMYAGRVVERGTAAQLFDEAWHPYTWGLLGSIPPLKGPRPRRLASIAGLPPQMSALPTGCAFGPRCACQGPRCATRPVLVGEGPHQAACVMAPAERAAARALCQPPRHSP